MFNNEIDEILRKGTVFYAHTGQDNEKELLIAHLELTLKYYYKLEVNKGLDVIVKNIIKDIFPKLGDEILGNIYNLFKAAIYYHDIGKINPSFQKFNMENSIKGIECNLNTEHSIYSSRIYVDAFIKDIILNCKQFNQAEKEIAILFTMYFGYVISMHHSKLKNLDKYIDNMFGINLYDLYISTYSQNQFDRFFDEETKKRILKIQNGNAESIYILLKLLYSMMIICDYYATYEYMNKKEINIEKEFDLSIFDKYTKSDLYTTIQKYKKNEITIQGINKLRTDMFIEVERNLQQNIDKNIFYLPAPTGAGKTNMSINIARILCNCDVNIKNIHYIFPFNTLIEQTGKVFEKYFEEYNDFVIVNSLNSMVNNEEENIDYNLAYIQSVFSHYPINITSHVNLFDTLFGTGKLSNFTLYNYINSVVILDEIQSYTNSKWRNIIYMLNKYAKLFNIKFVIMSATLPRLDYLLNDDKVEYVSLISNKNKYFEDPIFKYRVKIDYSLLDESISLDTLKEKVLEYKGKKILVEFIKKQTARDFYNLLKGSLDNVYEITGDDNNYNRRVIIDKVNNESDIIVISTQTIEAGVDIDMDIGFKDISILDSEEQFLGRINRSSKKVGSVAYFFNLDDEKKVYKNDYRLEYNLTSNANKKEAIKYLTNKDFDSYYLKVMDNIYNKTEKSNKNNFVNLQRNCIDLEYQNIEKEMRLIDSNTVQIFLNTTIEVEGKIIKGEDVWKLYKDICNNKEYSYSKRKIELSKLQEIFSFFVYNIYPQKTGEVQFSTDNIGKVYYIENGEEFVTNGKFDRKKYEQQVGGLIL